MTTMRHSLLFKHLLFLIFLIHVRFNPSESLELEIEDSKVILPSENDQAVPYIYGSSACAIDTPLQNEVMYFFHGSRYTAVVPPDSAAPHGSEGHLSHSSIHTFSIEDPRLSHLATTSASNQVPRQVYCFENSTILLFFSKLEGDEAWMHVWRFDALSQGNYSLTKTAEWSKHLKGTQIQQYAGKMQSNGSFAMSLFSQDPNTYHALFVDDLRPYPDVDLRVRFFEPDEAVSSSKIAFVFHNESNTFFVRNDKELRSCNADNFQSDCGWAFPPSEYIGSYWYTPSMGKSMEIQKDWVVTPHHVNSFRDEIDGYGAYLRFANVKTKVVDFRIMILSHNYHVYIRDYDFTNNGNDLFILLSRDSVRYLELNHYKYQLENNTYIHHKTEKIIPPDRITDGYVNLVIRDRYLYIYTNVVRTCAIFWRVSPQDIGVHEHMSLCGTSYLTASLAHANSRNYFGTETITPYLLSFTSNNEELLEAVRLPEDAGSIVGLAQVPTHPSQIFALAQRGTLFRFSTLSLTASPQILRMSSGYDLEMCCLVASRDHLFIVSKESNQTRLWKVTPSTMSVESKTVIPQLVSAETSHYFTYQSENFIAIAANEILVRIRSSTLELYGEARLLAADGTPSSMQYDNINGVLHVPTESGFIVIIDLDRMRRRFRMSLGTTLVRDVILLGDKGLAFYLTSSGVSRGLLSNGPFTLEPVSLENFAHQTYYSLPIADDRSSSGLLLRGDHIFVTSHQYPQQIFSTSYRFCIRGTYLLPNGLCRSCDLGTYASRIDAPSCLLAPPATYVPSVGAAQPTLCPKGTFGLKDVQGATRGDICIFCPVGQYGDSEGLVSSGVGTFNCTPCPTGTYNGVVVGASSVTDCEFCPVGFKGIKQGATLQQDACGPCGVGQYNDEAGRESCKTCPAGRSHKATGSTHVSDCVLCPAGSYSTSFDLTCIPCPYSTYLDTVGGTSQEECLKCPIGKGHSNLGAISASSCTSCPSGFHFDHTKELCQPCPPGSYLEGDFSLNKTCSLCPKGTYFSGEGGTSSSVCESCPLGSYASEDGSNVCTKCKKGYFGNTHQGVGGIEFDTSCIDCPPGTYQPEEGAPNANSCLECPPGTFLRNGTGTSLADCAVCPLNTFSREAGASSCDQCNECKFIGSSLSPSSLTAILSRPRFTSTESEEKRSASFDKDSSLFPGAKIVIPICVGVLLSCLSFPFLIVCCCCKRSIKSALADLDLVFPRRHIVREGEPVVKRKTILGGLTSLLTFVVICACLSIIFFDFFAYNIIETEGLSLDSGVSGEQEQATMGNFEYSVFLYGVHSECRMDGEPTVKGMFFTHNESRCEFVNEPPRVGCYCFWKCSQCYTNGQVDIDFFVKEPIMTPVLEYFINVPYSRPGLQYNMNGSLSSSDALQIYTGSEKPFVIDFILFSSVYWRSKRGLEMFFYDLFRVGVGGWRFEGWLPRLRRTEEPTGKRMDRFSVSNIHVIFRGTRGETQHTISENKTQTVTQFIASLASTAGMIISIFALALMLGENLNVQYRKKKQRKIISSMGSEESVDQGSLKTGGFANLSLDRLDDISAEYFSRQSGSKFSQHLTPYPGTETELPRNVSQQRLNPSESPSALSTYSGCQE